MAGPYFGTNKLGNNGGRFYSFLNRPVLIDCSFVVDSTNGNGLGIRNLKGAGVQNVFMHTISTPGIGNNGVLNPNPSSGFALIQLANNYNRYSGGFSGFVSPLSGTNLAINASALTIGQPYVISSVGHGSAGSETITTVADSSGSLASTWLSVYDNYGNTFILWFQVGGVGSAPQGTGGQLVPVAIAENASSTAVAAALVTVIENLPSGISGVDSFTASNVANVVTVVSTQNQPLSGVAANGAISPGFTYALVNYSTNLQDWQGVGLMKGLVPTAGQAFVATATGYSTGGGSTGLVQAPSVSGIGSIEVVGDANQTIAPGPMGGSPNVGGWIMVQMLAPTSSSVTTPIPTAPASGSVVGMSFYVEAGSILIAGE